MPGPMSCRYPATGSVGARSDSEPGGSAQLAGDCTAPSVASRNWFCRREVDLPRPDGVAACPVVTYRRHADARAGMTGVGAVGRGGEGGPAAFGRAGPSKPARRIRAAPRAAAATDPARLRSDAGVGDRSLDAPARGRASVARSRSVDRAAALRGVGLQSSSASSCSSLARALAVWLFTVPIEQRHHASRLGFGEVFVVAGAPPSFAGAGGVPAPPSRPLCAPGRGPGWCGSTALTMASSRAPAGAGGSSTGSPRCGGGTATRRRVRAVRPWAPASRTRPAPGPPRSRGGR